MPDIRVQDEQGNIHVFPDGSTPDMIAKALNVGVAAPQPSGNTGATMSAVKEPDSLGGKVEKLWNDFSSDIRTGTENTVVGRGLKRLGVQPTNNGQGQGVGDFMASPLLGTARAAEGVGQTMQEGKRVQGAKNVVGGLMDASQIPASFASPLEGEAVAKGAGKAGAVIADKAGAALKPTAKMGERVIQTLSKTAEAEGFKFAPKSVPEAFSSLTDQFIGRAKAAYKALDAAVEGELQPVLDKISDLKKAAKVQSNLDPEKASEMLQKVEELTTRKNQIVARAAQNGMPDAEKVLAQADKDYSRGKALEALTKKAKGASGAAREGGKTNPSKFATVVDNVANQEKITRGLGGDALSELQGHARNALKTKKAQKVIPAAAAGGYGLHRLYGAVAD